MLNVLIACEESQTVCTEFRKLGHRAFSCDIQECSGGHPEWHILGDVIPLLNGRCTFTTMDGQEHCIDGKWDLIVAHPPCTYLSAAGAVRLYDRNHNVKDSKRLALGTDAAEFFCKFIECDCEHVAIENPIPLSVFELPKYSQIINPFNFGDPWKKRTCLWLYGLPSLNHTEEVDPIGYWIGAHGHNKAPAGMSKGFRDQKTRSKTFRGIARAIAEQWSTYLIEERKNELE